MRTEKRRLLSVILSACFVLSALCLAPARASAEGGVIDRVLCSLNYPPVAMMELSLVNVTTSSTHCTITSAFWTDSAGSPVTDVFGTGSYTLNVSYAANPGLVFASNVPGYVNNNGDGVTVSVSEDGLSATLRKTFTAEVWAPTALKQPTGETVDVGGWASFVVSSNYTESREWFFESPDGRQSVKANDAAGKWPSVTVSGQDSEKLVVHNIPAELDGWKVFCRHWSAGHLNYTDSARATITVKSAPTPTPAVEITPVPLETPSPTPEEALPPALTPEPMPVITPEPMASAAPAAPAQRSFAYSADSSAHWRVYADNGENGEREEHLYVWHETRAATAEQAGEETGVCSICGQTVTRPLAYGGSAKSGLAQTLGVEGLTDVQLYLLGGAAVCLLLLILSAALSPRKARRRRK